MKEFETIRHTLVDLFQDIMTIEGKAIITEEFKDISNNDMHVIEAIGVDEPRNMSSVAKDLSVTVGTLTIAINNLVKKGYVKRVRSEQDRRVVLLSLSEKGTKAFYHHQNFHNDMVTAIIRDLGPEETTVLVKALTNLTDFFHSYGQSDEQ